ncbi:MAG: serine/threonine protein kinase [Pyrinomonadaceae bacterium]
MKACPACGKEYSNTSTLCPVDGAVLQKTEDPLIGETLAGKYLVEELIKRGGMGAVYRGKHILMDKRVAIKVLHPSLAVDDHVVARFSREAKAASRISHPHAVSVTDFGEAENGVVFLVMEYLDGRTLKDFIKSKGPMPIDQVSEILRQVAGALDAAHEQGVVHRDLKSDNIMISDTKGGEWAKVLDFGIAKIQQPEGVRDVDITAANLVIGTPQYMSPEQCSQSGPIDARSDVYSLGIIVYEMFVGRVPFTGESPTVIMMKQVQDEPPSILEARPDLPPEVGKILARTLAKQPDDRFQTAGELSKALADVATEVEGSIAVGAPATVANAPVAILDDDLDEATLVSPRQPVDEVTVVEARRETAPLLEPLPPAAPPVGNPWRIMIPAAIALVAVFGVVFLLTRGSGQTQSPNANVSQTGLVPDANSQPVQPMGTPTGESERNIQSQPSTTPTPRIAEVNANVNPAPATLPSTVGSNSNRESPTPKPTPKPVDDEPPPPKPTATVRAAPKSTPTPDGN